MSATIPSTMLLSDLLKPTGYDCPQDLQGKTFDQSTAGGGSSVVLEDNKAVTITANGTTEITPSAGKDGMKKVTATVNVPSDAKPEQTKSVTITENGTTTVTPDSGKTLSSVSITTNVSGGSGSGSVALYAWDVENVTLPQYSGREYFPWSVAPATKADFAASKQALAIQADSSNPAYIACQSVYPVVSYERTSDTTFTAVDAYDNATMYYTRVPSADVTIW